MKTPALPVFLLTMQEYKYVTSRSWHAPCLVLGVFCVKCKEMSTISCNDIVLPYQSIVPDKSFK